MAITIDISSIAKSADGIRYSAYRAGDAPVGGARTITGTGFGSGPTVLLYDTFEANTDAQLIDLNGAEVGAWDSYNSLTAGSTNTAYASDFDSKTWLALRQPANVANNSANLSSLIFDFGSLYKDFTFAFRWVVPTGFKFTDSANANEIAGSANSRFKMNWFYDSSISANPDDVVIPTVPNISSMQVLGNGVSPQSLSGGDVYFSFNNSSGVNENLFVYGQDENTGSNWDGVIETIQHTNGYYNRNVETDCKPFEPNAGTPPFNGYQKAIIPGWIGNHDTFVNSQTLYKDIYIAGGANHRAMLLLHDATTLAASTKVYVVAPDTWSDTQITCTPKTYQDLTYASVIDANGTLQENV